MDKKKVLVVDDDATVSEMLKTGLEYLGYEICVAPNAQSVWQCIENAKPDVILMDIGMPGVDGISLCRDIRFSPELCDIPVIMVTAFSDERTFHEAMFFGADDFLSKPFDISDVHKKISIAIDKRKMKKEGT